MKKCLLIGCMVLFAVAMISVSPAAADQEVNIELKKDSEGAIRPDLDTATVILNFHDVQDGSARMLLRSPERKLLSPTDFPNVEGTALIDSTLSIKEGKASFEYMFPIRGDYPVSLELLDKDEKPLRSYQLVIHIQENPEEIQNAILFTGLLGAFGLFVGWALSKRRGNLHAV
jgi:hypothetical protein